MDNTIRNVLFKIERYAAARARGRGAGGRASPSADRGGPWPRPERKAERLRLQARRADLKLAQLDTLTPEGFEEFVAELFESLGFEVDRVGGTGDEGADLRVERAGLRGVVQCKYHKKGVVGSPELQKFLGTIHHTSSHKGFFRDHQDVHAGRPSASPAITRSSWSTAPGSSSWSARPWGPAPARSPSRSGF